MLSRVENVRVFESSEDVILKTSSRHYSQLNGAAQQQLRSRRFNAETEAEEDKQLHPQHPYRMRMRKRVLQRESEEFHQLVGKDARSSDQVLVPFSKPDNRPMELVFLSSGEIRAREDCLPGLGLPKLQQEQIFNNGNGKPSLEYRGEEDSDGESEEDEEFQEDEETNRRQAVYEKKMDRRRTNTQMKTSRQRRRQQVARQHYERFASSASSSSRRSLPSVSEDADVSSDAESESVVSKISEESGRQEKERVVFQAQSRRQVTRNADNQAGIQERSVAATGRNSVKRKPTRSLKLKHLRREEEDDMSDHATDRVHSAQRTTAFREEEASSRETTSRESRQRPAPLEQVSQVSQLEGTNDVPTRRTKRSPKMEVSHLVSDEPTPKPKGRTSSTTRRDEKMIDRLGSELQKEKKRVLEKMTHLLDEQGKNQQLRDRIEMLEAQLAAKDSETTSKIREAVREQEEQTQFAEKEQDARVNALEEQVRLHEANIARLKHDKDQLKTALKQLKKTGSNLSNDQRSDTRETEGMRAELDDMTRRLHEFLANVDRWKSTSKEEIQNCDAKTNLSALLENVWLDFPQFPGVSARLHKENSSPSSEQQQQSTSGADEQADVVLFLKKRLRQREDELRHTHVKYVELKELCARQCVREADLQNFINEHRLRGNLIIRKNSGTKPNEAGNNQEQARDDHQDEHRRSAKLKVVSSRDTNTPASNNERDGEDEDFVNEEYSDNQEDNDNYEDGEEYEYPVRTPKVFIQVGRDGVYEHASPTNSAVAQKLAADRSRGKRKTQPKQQQQQQQQRVERIRLVPSPSLTQRYERVPTPTPTMTTARRKKSAQQPFPQPSSRSHAVMLGECPPGCGSRPSFLRKKTPTAAARAKRPVVTTASNGAVGVIRPWM